MWQLLHWGCYLVANLPKATPRTTIKVDEFKGLIKNNSYSETEIDLGHSVDMLNFRITDNKKLKKIEGTYRLGDAFADSPINGMIYADLGVKKVFLVAHGGKLYEIDLSDGSKVEKGSLNDAETFMFEYSDRVYIVDQNEYYSYDGTNLKLVEGHIPLVSFTSHDGNITQLNPVNLIQPKRTQRFTGDGSEKTFTMLTPFDSVHEIKVYNADGTETILNPSDYTFDAVKGTITLNAAIADKLFFDVTYVKDEGTRDRIVKNRKAVKYSANQTVVFFFGNPDTPSTLYRTRIDIDDVSAKDNILTPDYFPVTDNQIVGTTLTPVTDVQVQSNNVFVFKPGETWALLEQYSQVTNQYEFITAQISAINGNKSFGQSALIENTPVTFDDRATMWQLLNIGINERSAVNIDNDVKQVFEDGDLSNVRSLNWISKNELWVQINDEVYVYNYGLKLWYQFGGFKFNCHAFVDNKLYFGDDNGNVYYFDSKAKNFGNNDVPMEFKWYSGYSNLKKVESFKYLQTTWIEFQPEGHTDFDYRIRNNERELNEPYNIRWRLFSWARWNYADFSWQTKSNPQPKTLKTKIKKFSNIQLIIEGNKLDADCTILSINLKIKYGSDQK